MIRITYMGTPDYAVPALERLAQLNDVDVALVVTQPDRPQGRGRLLQSPPVKRAAAALGVPVLQTGTLRDPTARAALEASSPDLIVVAAFGLILGSTTLGLPRLGCVNLHASLLPAYRGANPIAAAVARGESETGVTLMAMDRGLDTGDIIATRSIGIAPTDSTATLTPRLAELGADLLIDTLPALSDGTAPRRPQPDNATLTRPMVKDDGWIDWAQPAERIDAHVRAMDPWPRAWTTFEDGSRLIVHALAPAAGEALRPGEVIARSGEIQIGTATSAIALMAGQLPGGKVLQGSSLVDRLRPFAGTKLGRTGEPAVREPLVVLAG
jgi:methionyl-tRNA formyltransferase